ncbi:MAG: S-adenosylmethionine decarboxylase proenzyme [Caldiserica bacterium]|nr:MAG: S-adenosylmethionine decarboxylase proenzyme [Caldisericota bacterium]
MKKFPASLGRHIVAEFYGCNHKFLNNVEAVEEFMIAAAKKAGATIIDSVFHTFQPYGVSGVVVIAESHLAIHTWPEYGFASIDIYTCGEDVDPWKAFEYLEEILEPENTSVLELKRGVFPTKWSGISRRIKEIVNE